MIRELRRFKVRDAQGQILDVSEIAAFIVIDGQEIKDGIPTLLTRCGRELFAGDACGEFRIPREGRIVHEV